MGYFSSLEFIQLYFYSMFIFLIFELSFRCIRSASNVCTMYNKSLDTHAKSLRREKARPSLWPQKYQYHLYLRPLTIVWAPKEMISLKRSPQQILICNEPSTPQTPRSAHCISVFAGATFLMISCL